MVLDCVDSWYLTSLLLIFYIAACGYVIQKLKKKYANINSLFTFAPVVNEGFASSPCFDMQYLVPIIIL